MLRQSTNKGNVISLLNPSSPISEVYKTLRTNVQFSSIDTPFKTIMATSAIKGEGKTTTVSNLAVAYAQEGKKVILIDCDLRSPSIHQVFSQSNHAGLTNILANQNQWQEVVRDTTIDTLSLLTSGPIPPNPAELLASRRMQSLIEELKQHYDMIFFDVPPVLAVTDSLVVSALSDGVILVVNAGKVDKELVRKTKASLEHVNARLIGVVLNRINRSERKAALQYYD
ncbi:CpsD/CapB family tyrosine-protein kinase [Cohnella sp. REN36]|uniref:CpsD/CapB family tyrosine-protein kinase n=1 Tax=Cohnella sp. REN36 TaxID=2887347 RepID=UPI001D142CC4|nr:CpsD/CapB family tyrosine-protein kinase [Cohnella sp. REN36]MCC3375991.1 CpsD/CapB family tyrosine-protein kinase [Cohnella sp. REN36]